MNLLPEMRRAPAGLAAHRALQINWTTCRLTKLLIDRSSLFLSPFEGHRHRLYTPCSSTIRLGYMSTEKTKILSFFWDVRFLDNLTQSVSTSSRTQCSRPGKTHELNALLYSQ